MVNQSEFCGDCEFYYYTNHKKMEELPQQEKLCWRKPGECKEFGIWLGKEMSKKVGKNGM